jgi:hypothetical protein
LTRAVLALMCQKPPLSRHLPHNASYRPKFEMNRCYRVEARSEALRNRTGVPFNANVPAVMFNWGVARDEQTQRLRRRMNYRLLACVGGFGLGWLVLWGSGAVGD